MNMSQEQVASPSLLGVHKTNAPTNIPKSNYNLILSLNYTIFIFILVYHVLLILLSYIFNNHVCVSITASDDLFQGELQLSAKQIPSNC